VILHGRCILQDDGSRWTDTAHSVRTAGERLSNEDTDLYIRFPVCLYLDGFLSIRADTIRKGVKMFIKIVTVVFFCVCRFLGVRR